MTGAGSWSKTRCGRPPSRNGPPKPLQARLKLCRHFGLWNILVTHRLSDMRAQADDGTSASKVAAGLVGDIQTKVVFRQATDQLDDAQQLFRLNEKTAGILPELTKGRCVVDRGRPKRRSSTTSSVSTRWCSPTPTRPCRPETR